MDSFEAAKILYRNGETQNSLKLLERIWELAVENPESEFKIFCAGAEVSLEFDAAGVADLIESAIVGEGNFKSFWQRRDLSEQAVLFDWLGQIAYKLGDKSRAYESLTRAASLGRDTVLMWRLLGQLCAENREIDLGLRYAKRSLFLYRNPDLNLLSGQDYILGFFTGKSPLGISNSIQDYLGLLLTMTKEAKGQKSFKGVRDFVLELIHQFPHETRLPKIRNLVENHWVSNSLRYDAPNQPSL